MLVLVFLVLAFRYPDVIRDFFDTIVEVDLSLRGFRVRRAVRAASQAVAEKEHREPDKRALRSTLSEIPPFAKVLWVDDHPDNNKYEIDTLERLGMDIDTVRSNAEAEAVVWRKVYDLIISDIGRGPPETPTAGLELPAKLADISLGNAPIIYYTGYATSPKTPGGHPVTDRPSELFNLITSEIGLRGVVDTRAEEARRGMQKMMEERERREEEEARERERAQREGAEEE
jgi:CheY-like chemotaxis protein